MKLELLGLIMGMVGVVEVEFEILVDEEMVCFVNDEVEDSGVLFEVVELELEVELEVLLLLLDVEVDVFVLLSM